MYACLKYPHALKHIGKGIHHVRCLGAGLNNHLLRLHSCYLHLQYNIVPNILTAVHVITLFRRKLLM